MLVGFVCNVVCSCLFLSIYIRVSKNVIECALFVVKFDQVVPHI